MKEFTPQERIKQFRDLYMWIHKTREHSELIDKLKLPSSARNNSALSLIQNAHEHCYAMSLLIEQNLHGAALALERPAIESYFRGVWFLKVCKEENVGYIVKKDKFPRNLKKLVKEIENVDSQTAGWMKKLLTVRTVNNKSLISVLHSLTHGGRFQISPALADRPRNRNW